MPRSYPCVLGIALGLVGWAPAADWPQFLGPTRDGVVAETGLARSWPKEGPKVLWKKEVGEGYGGPVIAGNRLVLHHRVANQEVVECFDPATGERRWKGSYRTTYRDALGRGDGPRSTPLIAGERVITLGPDGDLCAWSLPDGMKLWQRNINADYQVRKGFFGAGTSPLLAAGKVLVNVGGPGASVVAFDPATGKEVWKAGDDPVSYSSPVLTKLGGEEQAVFFTRAGLLTLTPEKGTVRYTHSWRPRNPNSVNAASPVVVGERIFLSTSYDTGGVLLEVRDGVLKEVWKNQNLSAHFNTPVHHKGHLYGIDGRQEYGAKLCCVDWETGQLRWSKEAFGCATILKVDDLGLALTERGELVLFELAPAGYKELAGATILGGNTWATPALADGRLYATDGKQLVCVDLKK